MHPRLLLALLFFAMTPQVHAQFSSEIGIAGSGSVVLERPADRMKMQVDLLAKSTRDLPDAIAKLKARQAKAEKQLESLGAIKDSVKFSEARIDDSEDDSQRQIQIMMRQRLASGGRGKKPTREALAKPIKVTMKLSAEWPVQGGDPIAQLVTTKKLQDAIKAADLGGVKDAEEPTPEEAEAAEEMEMEMGYGGRQGPKPGEPAFVFASRIPAAELEKARSDAFRSAKQEAMELAKAAEIELGALRSLHSSNAVDSDDSEAYQYMYQSGYGNMLRRQMNTSDAGEAIGAAPGLLKYRVGVTASFEIKPGK